MNARALLFAFLLAGCSAVFAAPPEVPTEPALKLAQEPLAERGLSGAHESLVIEKSSLGGERYSFARWKPSVKADGKSESARHTR